MRRYGQSNDSVVVKGPSAGVSFTLSKAAEPIIVEPVCEFNPKGLYWYSEETGLYDSKAEAGLLENYSDNVDVTPDFVLTKPQYHWTAKLLGELCDYRIDFVANWSGDFPPHYDYSDNGELFVFPRDDNKDEAGVMTITARVLDGNAVIYTSNEIYLVITSASYYYTVSQGGGGLSGLWVNAMNNYTPGYEILDGSYSPEITVNYIQAYPYSRMIFYFNVPNATRISTYCNDGGGGWYKINGGPQLSNNRGAMRIESPGISITGLTTIEIEWDGYGSQFWLWIK